MARWPKSCPANNYANGHSQRKPSGKDMEAGELSQGGIFEKEQSH